MPRTAGAGYIRMVVFGAAFIVLTLVLIIYQPGSPRNARSQGDTAPAVPAATSAASKPKPTTPVDPAPNPSVAGLSPSQTPPTPQVLTATRAEPVQIPDPVTLETENPIRDMTFQAIANVTAITTGAPPSPGQPGSLLHSVVQRSIAHTTTAPPPDARAPRSNLSDDSATDTYRVEAGDTLLSIARNRFGDSAKASEIYENNRQILTSPDSLRPGMVLKLPPW